ncbi:MAG: NAD(P)H-dependent flavin oxidoreductase [Reyranella sp.]|uniref:NAD(P)H-dependent flavin oxidoreductase n=1 Tax=Reyranella sp. TaxID=1929291 RepID=UPI003D13D583
MKWQDRRLLELFGIEHPIIQAPMAGPTTPQMAIAASKAGALGSLAAAMLTPDLLRGELQTVRQQTDRPINVNFFCHIPPAVDADREAAWRKRLARYYDELGVPASAADGGAVRTPYGSAMAALLLEFRPKVASFHFGLPEEALLKPLRDAGILILSSATTVEEARWLEARGVDAVIAQGAEAGGHRGMFLTDDIASQPGTMALVPQVVDAVKVPVIAAGGIADGRGIAAALALGAAGVQLGTAFLLSPEAKTSQVHRAALKSRTADVTALTNVFTGRPARGIANRIMREVGPITSEAPSFPLAAGAATPLRVAGEARGSGEFSPLWSGQSALLAREMPAGAMVAMLVEQTQAVLKRVRG